MRTNPPPAVCRALAVLSLLAAALWSPVPATATSGPHAGAAHSLATVPPQTSPQRFVAASYAGPCTDDLGVTVVVDYQGLGGSTVVRCAPGSNGRPFSGTGLDAFQAAGLSISGTNTYGLSVVCRVNGRPAADEPLPIPGNEGYTEQCLDMPPATAFWSYWQADNNGSWTFSQLGVKASTARAGGFESLSFSLNSTSAPPRTAPSRPAPAPAPEPQPEPSDPAPQPPAPSQPAPSRPSPAQPAPSPSDTAPTQPDSGTGVGNETDDPGSEAAATDEGGPSGADLAERTSAPDTTDATSAPTTDAASDAAAQTQTDTAAGTPTPELNSAELANPTDGAGGPTALWVTFGILLLLGALAGLASRRRRDPGITHQVSP